MYRILSIISTLSVLSIAAMFFVQYIKSNHERSTSGKGISGKVIMNDPGANDEVFRSNFPGITDFNDKIEDVVTTFYYPSDRDHKLDQDRKMIILLNPREPPKHGFGVYVKRLHNTAELERIQTYGFGGEPAAVNDERIVLKDRTIRHFEDSGNILLLVELRDAHAYTVQATGIAGYREDDRAAAWLIAATITSGE